IRRRTQVFRDAHPDARLVNLGIGDVTRPLPDAVIKALHAAIDEMARAETFRGYGPYAGYEFLLSEIAAHDFGPRGVRLGVDEIFVSDGGKSDSANLQELFAAECVVALMDPVYPVYAESNVVAGRSGPADESGRYPGFVYLPCTAENRFQPALPSRHVDLIYLCYPNNPTGAVATREALARWVDYARAEDAIILFDAAYEAYVVDADVPRSIYEIEGAREVAIESRSFSKTAGFTGMRLAYTVVPKGERARAPRGRRPDRPQPALDPPRRNQVQRPALPHPEGGGRGLHARGPEAGAHADRRLHDEGAHHRGRPDRRGLGSVRRPERALYLVPHAGRHTVLGLLRSAPGTGAGAGRPRRRLRSQRRGLLPTHRVRLAGRRGGGG